VIVNTGQRLSLKELLTWTSLIAIFTAFVRLGWVDAQSFANHVLLLTLGFSLSMTRVFGTRRNCGWHLCH
jgi:hypothetical protein